MTAPALATFVDGTVVHQGDLNGLVTNINILADNTAGKRQASQYLRPKLTLAKSTTQAVNDATIGLVNWTSAGTNTDNMWSASTPNQINIQTAGLFHLNFSCLFQNGLTSSGNRSIVWILVNGTALGNIIAGNSASIYNNGWWLSTSTVVQLAAGASVYFAAYQESGATATLDNGLGGCSASATFLAK